MKKLLSIILLLLAFSSLNAQQTYGNSWINHNQQYFKFPITKEGIYRIDSTTLAKKFDLNSLNPHNLQLFIKGKEQHLFIKGDSDNKINTADYIEFYANNFSGDVDSLIFWNIQYIPNYYSGIFNDTLYGFLTVNNLTTNKRYQIESDTNTVAYPEASYFYTERVFTSKSNYNHVREYSYDVSDPRYTQAEGYGQIFTKGNSIATNFGNLKTYTASVLPCYLSLKFSGASVNLSSFQDHQVQTVFTDAANSPVILADTTFKGFAPVKQFFTISSNTINDNTIFSLSSVASPLFMSFTNSTILHNLNFFYPHNLDLNNQTREKLYIDNHLTSQKQSFRFTSFNLNGSTEVAVYDLTDFKKIETVLDGPYVKAVVPNGSGRKFCYMTGETGIYRIDTLIGVNSNSGSFTNFKSTNAVKPFVIVYHKATKNGALAYKNHRQSSSGGSYNVIAADIDELYEQFAFGVNKHPASIRNFISFLNDSLPAPPEYVFIIGKAAGSSYGPTPQDNLIPTMGIPSCDNLLTSHLTPAQDQLVPAIPIGRIAALNDAEVNTYLAKVQQHESSGQADWKKKVLHFVGGDEPNLTATLSSYMDFYKSIVENPFFGGYTLTFKKNTTAPIQTNISDSIKSTISNGAALINFFGHGSDQGFDQAIDDPEVYTNTGKYPFVIANSCYSGNIHVSGRRSVSERFVFSHQKGSIGFLATTSLGFVYSLHNYTSKFYNALSQTHYNKGVGNIVKEAVFQNSLYPDAPTKFTGLDMTLHGDPSLKISNGELPDYQINTNSVVFDTKTHSDSIGIKIHIKNLGRAVADSFWVKTERFFPNGDSTTIFKTIRAPYYKDSVSFFIQTDFNRGVGLNKFRVRIDEYNEIAESNETNNSVGFLDLFIQGGDIVPVYPYKYAVVPKTNTLTLKASTPDPFAPLTTYRFQLDTCDKFVNPVQTAFISSKGGVLEWTVNLPFADSTVYFWRVSRDSTSPSNAFSWRESSFQTIGTKHGWGQAHFHQFKNDGYQFVQYRKDLRKFIFQNSKHSVSARNFFANATNVGVNINWFYNNITMSNWGCAPQGWNFAVLDQVSGQPHAVVSVNYPDAGPGTYSNCVCVPSQVLRVYSFGAGNYCGFPNWKTDMETFLNSVTPGDYVLAYTVGDFTPGYAQITTYDNSLYNAFESIGAGNIRNISDTVPYILFGRKGMSAGQGNEVIGTNKSSIITLQDSIETKWDKGYIASELIGPSFKWNSLHWRVQSMESAPGDTTFLKIVRIKHDGATDTLPQVFIQDSTDILAFHNYVDASVYPYIKLVAFMRDMVHTTSPQLKRWQVLYDEAPECAINPLKGFVNLKDSIQEGDNARFVIPIENIGIKNFEDSLLITYWVEDVNRNIHPLPSKLKYKPFKPNEVMLDTVSMNSYQFPGSNILWMYVNPIGKTGYQLEQYQFNNIARFSFKVSRDVTNPLLDVTFDGVRILNGDIVSAKPNILITLKDENQFLLLNDTSAFNVYLTVPGQSQKEIFFTNDLLFTPATNSKNSASILFNPTLPIDGKYLLSVQASDRSNNKSGVQNYQIQFEVNNKPTVTNVMNYPNPFTTSTRFVFTLTGSEVPEVFTIQIMTITGKIVREITRTELGHLHIGRNITEYAWDGRDMYGDRLANGVYLYKVVTKLNGESIEKSETGADKFFVKEFGKMVLMR